MNIKELHPAVWEGLLARKARLPHALLLAGQRGIGKYALAMEFAASLLCETPAAGGNACGKCLPCGWQAQGNHPDFRLLRPDALEEADGAGEEEKKGDKKASQQIRIEQIRALDEFFNIGTHRGGLRIVVVQPAEAMNRNTANALLKTLEEPPPNTLFLLISDEPMRLLPTIRSRCQALPVPLPDTARAEALLAAEGVAEPARWLALAGGAPLLARELAASGQAAWLEQLARGLATGPSGDPLAAAADIDKLLRETKGRLGLRQFVEWAQKWVIDLALVRHGLGVRYFVGQRATIEQLAARAAVHSLMRFHRKLLQWRREAEHPLNARLFLENFFLDYRALFRN